MTQQACIVSKLGLEFPSKLMFQNLNFTLYTHQVSALIGRNGQGKSLLMQILNQSHHLPVSPESQILWQTKYAYLPQFQRLSVHTIAQALDVEELYFAFNRVEKGIANFNDYDVLDGKWHLLQDWQQLLQQANLPIDLDFPISHLSEGQQTKLALVQLFSKKDHYLLLDEPSNHLDNIGREWLIQHLENHPAGALMISHDRTLLNTAQHIYHLNMQGLQHVKGNYDTFFASYQNDITALEHRIQQSQREIIQIKQKQNESLMKAEKREKIGKKTRASNSQAKILLDFKKEQSTKTQAALRTQQQRQVLQRQDNLAVNKQLLEKVKPQQFHFSQFKPYTGEILRVKSFELYNGARTLIDLVLMSGEKIHLAGKNGIGKSTLLQQISSINHSTQDEIFLAVNSFYLDQNFRFLNHQQSAIDNLHSMNPEIPVLTWRNLLGQLRIRGDKGEYPLSFLSGGEQLKVALLAIESSSPVPELLLLDEPENHLDIESRTLLASAIQSYQGAVILVSHDQHFVESCGIKKKIELV